jgi:hypothetical protein
VDDGGGYFLRPGIHWVSMEILTSELEVSMPNPKTAIKA